MMTSLGTVYDRQKTIQQRHHELVLIANGMMLNISVIEKQINAQIQGQITEYKKLNPITSIRISKDNKLIPASLTNIGSVFKRLAVAQSELKNIAICLEILSGIPIDTVVLNFNTSKTIVYQALRNNNISIIHVRPRL